MAIYSARSKHLVLHWHGQQERLRTVAWARQTHEEKHKQTLEESGLLDHDLWVSTHAAKEKAKEKKTFEKKQKDKKCAKDEASEAQNVERTREEENHDKIPSFRG